MYIQIDPRPHATGQQLMAMWKFAYALACACIHVRMHCRACPVTKIRVRDLSESVRVGASACDASSRGTALQRLKVWLARSDAHTHAQQGRAALLAEVGPDKPIDQSDTLWAPSGHVYVQFGGPPGGCVHSILKKTPRPTSYSKG